MLCCSRALAVSCGFCSPQQENAADDKTEAKDEEPKKEEGKKEEGKEEAGTAAAPARSEGKEAEKEAEDAPSSDKSRPAKAARTEPPLNQKSVERPMEAYDIMCFTQQLSDMSVAVYFHSSARKMYAPYLPPFRATFQDGLRETLYISAIGVRCTEDGKPMRSREAQSEEQAERFGWPVFVTDMVEDANMYAFHLCNTLNGSSEYIESFDAQRRFSRKPFFIVTKNTTANPPRKWDQVMVRKDVLKYVCNKFNLRDMQVRMQYSADGRWENLLQHYFTDVDSAKVAIEAYIEGDDDTGFTF